MHNHLRQNMCPEHPNRNLANGPNHPGPGPEDIPMVDVCFRGFLTLLQHTQTNVHQMDVVFYNFFLFFTLFHLPKNSTYQRMSRRLNVLYGLLQRAHFLPVMPLPDLTTLPHELIHQLTGEHPAHASS